MCDMCDAIYERTPFSALVNLSVWRNLHDSFGIWRNISSKILLNYRHFISFVYNSRLALSLLSTFSNIIGFLILLSLSLSLSVLTLRQWQWTCCVWVCVWLVVVAASHFLCARYCSSWRSHLFGTLKSVCGGGGWIRQDHLAELIAQVTVACVPVPRLRPSAWRWCCCSCCSRTGD